MLPMVACMPAEAAAVMPGMRASSDVKWVSVSSVVPKVLPLLLTAVEKRSNDPAAASAATCAWTAPALSREAVAK